MSTCVIRFSRTKYVTVGWFGGEVIIRFHQGRMFIGLSEPMWQSIVNAKPLIENVLSSKKVTGQDKLVILEDKLYEIFVEKLKNNRPYLVFSEKVPWNVIGFPSRADLIRLNEKEVTTLLKCIEDVEKCILLLNLIFKNQCKYFSLLHI